MDDLQELFDQIEEAIEADPAMDEEMKDKALNILDQVAEDPSENNLKALYLVIKKLRDVDKYLSAIETLKSLKESNSISEDEEEDQETLLENSPGTTPVVTPQQEVDSEPQVNIPEQQGEPVVSMSQVYEDTVPPAPLPPKSS